MASPAKLPSAARLLHRVLKEVRLSFPEPPAKIADTAAASYINGQFRRFQTTELEHCR